MKGNFTYLCEINMRNGVPHLKRGCDNFPEFLKNFEGKPRVTSVLRAVIEQLTNKGAVGSFSVMTLKLNIPSPNTSAFFTGGSPSASNTTTAVLTLLLSAITSVCQTIERKPTETS